ncbi:MAG: UDP-N-acetylmuramoyl-L-alanine--D-glutamate ligase [Treponema sp.]|nr:UDP-N-acetylmuramoyl-L-alanine--D-glutamate ligase [Treponema sp.]
MSLNTLDPEARDLAGLRVTVMGLGLNGGGLASARFFALRGAAVTVTDMKDETALAESLAALEGLPIRYVLGRHEMDDFSGADLVIKNPAVRADSPFLASAKAVETDISTFLRYCPGPVAAVTGSKGKSTTASALAHALSAAGTTFLGGNITVSPLSFLDQVRADTPVVLEISSWQLGDLRGRRLLRPRVAVLTRIVPDHLDRYPSMEAYVADKRLIYADQDPSCYTVCDRDDPYGRSFGAETPGTAAWYADSLEAGLSGAWFEGSVGVYRDISGRVEEILPERLKVPGPHARRNLLAAALGARLMGAPAETIFRALGEFPGVEHRLEMFLESGGVRFCNDSAATVPQAVEAALLAFDSPVVLITGGTDKNLDFTPVRSAYRRAKAIVLLAGTGSDKLRVLLDEDGTAYEGPYDDLEIALRAAAARAEPGDTVLLSPGCTSFGMFRNEFDRGRKFKECAARTAGARAYQKF